MFSNDVDHFQRAFDFRKWATIGAYAMNTESILGADFVAMAYIDVG